MSKTLDQIIDEHQKELELEYPPEVVAPTCSLKDCPGCTCYTSIACHHCTEGHGFWPIDWID